MFPDDRCRNLAGHTTVKTFTNMTGKTGYHNSSVRNVTKCKQVCEVLLRTLSAAAFPPLGLAALTRIATSRQGTAR